MREDRNKNSIAYNVLYAVFLLFLFVFNLSHAYSTVSIDSTPSGISLINKDTIITDVLDIRTPALAEKINIDTTEVKKKKLRRSPKLDTTHYIPKKAALWALACPGLGQIYNKRYWKLPIVYGLMGTMAYFLASNVKNLRAYNGYIQNSFNGIANPYPQSQLTLDELEINRNTYRRNVQLSAFGTAFVWGLSIVDAVVDAHLHSFDISDKLSMKIKPQLQTIDNSYYTGIAINLKIK